MPEFRLKRSWSGKFILQIKITTYHTDPMDMTEYRVERWRRASLEDAQRCGIHLA